VISEDGIEPKILSMKREDRVAFFVNNSLDSLLSIAVQFGKNSTHCASANLEIQDYGMDSGGANASSVVRSTKPISPKDFATTCFHEPGTYPYTIRGLTSKNAEVGQKTLELHGSIIVE
jgi:hypothetical protein